MILLASSVCYAQGDSPAKEYKISKKVKQEIDRIGKKIVKIEKNQEKDAILKILGLYPISKHFDLMVIVVDDKTKRYMFSVDEYGLSLEYKKLLNGNFKLSKISVEHSYFETPIHEKIIK